LSAFDSQEPTNTVVDDEEEDWQSLFTYNACDMDQERHRRLRRQERELERFLEDRLDVHYTEYEPTADGWKHVTKTFMDCPLRWWRERGESLYPTLAPMAYDLLSIPAMSSECERIFSSTKKMITEERYQLKIDLYNRV
jgi:hAT family C-terminal dimerisation region